MVELTLHTVWQFLNLIIDNAYFGIYACRPTPGIVETVKHVDILLV